MCRNDSPHEKIDRPFASDSEIASMIEEFEQCRWPFERWTHRCHLAVGAWYLLWYPFDDALRRVRNGIKLYNQACGSGTGYHETITRLFVMGIQKRLAQANGMESLSEMVNEMAHTLTMTWVREQYSRERLESAEAKEGWLPPDRELRLAVNSSRVGLTLQQNAPTPAGV